MNICEIVTYLVGVLFPLIGYIGMYYIIYDIKIGKTFPIEILEFVVIALIVNYFVDFYQWKMILISLSVILILIARHHVDVMEALIISNLVYFAILLADIVFNAILLFSPTIGDAFLSFDRSFRSLIVYFLFGLISNVNYFFVAIISRKYVNIKRREFVKLLAGIGVVTIIILIMYGEMYLLFFERNAYTLNDNVYLLTIVFNFLLLIHFVGTIVIFVFLSNEFDKMMFLRGKYNSSMEKLNDEYRISHNTTNILLLIKLMLENEKYDEALAYLKENKS